ncbi:MAG: corrinoid protein [Candidatus Lokiarchaeia archaeon]
MSETEILERLKEAVILGDEDMVRKAAEEAIKAGISAVDAIVKGMSEGMKVVGKKFEDKEYFLPDLLASGAAMQTGIDLLKPHIKVGEMESSGTVVIGQVEGDIHTIGKGLVATMLELSGFKVYDIGEDVPAERFAEKAIEVNADIVAASCLLSACRPVMEKIEEALKMAEIRDQLKTMVGGAAVSESHARKIGADGYGDNAPEAVRIAKELVKKLKEEGVK